MSLLFDLENKYETLGKKKEKREKETLKDVVKENVLKSQQNNLKPSEEIQCSLYEFTAKKNLVCRFISKRNIQWKNSTVSLVTLHARPEVNY